MALRIPGWSLRTRFRVLIILILLAGGGIGFGGFLWYSQDWVNTLGGWFAERNALYEKSRLIQLLAREIVLVQKMARSPVLKAWVRAEGDPVLKERAIQELQGFRRFFHDRSFFFTVADSGNYYFDGPGVDGDASRPRYTLDRSISKDAWFYLTLDQVRDYQLNVDTDRHLKQTKIWINAVMHDAGKAVAVLGSGLDLTDFLERIINSGKEGVINILFDHDGAIQAHKDVSVIDFASIRRPYTGETRSTLYDFLTEPAAGAELRKAMVALEQGDEARVLDLVIDGRRYIAGISYLPEMKWFLLTLTNPERALDRHILAIVAVVFILTLAGTLFTAGYIFDRTVLTPLSILDRAARRMADGDYALSIGCDHRGELGHLIGTFDEMARRIHHHTADLERQVADRTRDLERLANTDWLTGHLNRRGLFDRLEAACKRMERHGGKLGFILLDIDHFKRCNDTYGHEVGDRALVHIADILRGNLRGYDLCSRWGGEEFLVVLDDVADASQAALVAEKLRVQVKEQPLEDAAGPVPLTISVGVCIAGHEEAPQSVIARVDAALYRAKEGGRDRVVLESESPAGGNGLDAGLRV